MTHVLVEYSTGTQILNGGHRQQMLRLLSQTLNDWLDRSRIKKMVPSIMRYLPLPRGNERAGTRDLGMSRDFRKCYTLSTSCRRAASRGTSEDNRAGGFLRIELTSRDLAQTDEFATS